MQNTLYGETEEHYQKHAFWVFLIMLPIKTLKYMQKTLFLGNERTLRETCIMSVFKFIKYEKAKSHKLHSLLRKNK